MSQKYAATLVVPTVAYEAICASNKEPQVLWAETCERGRRGKDEKYVENAF